jgi:hypothetical protein
LSAADCAHTPGAANETASPKSNAAIPGRDTIRIRQVDPSIGIEPE